MQTDWLKITCIFFLYLHFFKLNIYLVETRHDPKMNTPVSFKQEMKCKEREKWIKSIKMNLKFLLKEVLGEKLNVIK